MAKIAIERGFIYLAYYSNKLKNKVFLYFGILSFIKDYHKHRIVFIGDTAYAMNPLLGQGANLALTIAIY